MRNGSGTWYGSLDRLQKGALGYAFVMLVAIAALVASGAGSGTASDTEIAQPLTSTAPALDAPISATGTLQAVATGTPTSIIAPPILLRPSPSLSASPTVVATLLPAPTATSAPTPTPLATPAPPTPAPSVTLVQAAPDAFAQGTAEGVVLGPDGALALAPAVSDDFTGGMLDTATWQFAPWSPGGTVSVRDGIVTVNVAAIRTARTFVHGTFEARVRFTAGPPPFENIAWSADLNGPTAIMIGEPVDDPGHLYARIKQEGREEQRVQLPDSFDDYHVYRIVWGAARVDFSVDGTLRATIPATLDTPMQAWISAATAGHTTVVDWARIRAADPSSGIFTSAKLDAGGDVPWRIMQMDASIPPGAAVAVRTRTSTDGQIWSMYEPLAGNGVIASPPGRYFQYEIAFSGAGGATPSIRSVTVSHTSAA